VSTSIRDVIHPYGDQGLAHIADSPADFVAAVERALGDNAPAQQRTADLLLTRMSWERTWAEMDRLMQDALRCDSVGSDRANHSKIQRGTGDSRMGDGTRHRCCSHNPRARLGLIRK